MTTIPNHAKRSEAKHGLKLPKLQSLTQVEGVYRVQIVREVIQFRKVANLGS